MSDDTKVVYFSNGTEGHIWMDRFCNRCVHDHAFHTDASDQGCDHILNTVLEQFDPVFIRTTDVVIGQDGKPWEWQSWDCTEFSRCPCDRRDDPGVPLKPPPDPNQGALFDADVLMPGVWRDIVLEELAPAEAQR